MTEQRTSKRDFAELLAYLRAESSQYPKNILQIKGSEAVALVDEIERLQRRVAEPHPGTGVKCAHCNGSGKEAQVYDEQTGWSDEKACDTCNGSGRITTVEQYLKENTNDH